MSDIEKVLIGAIGGALVAVLGYPVTGYESIAILDGGGEMAAGLVLRAGSFAFLGGLWAYLHTSERDRFKTFQLGLLGPAILSAMVNANVTKVEADQLADLQPQAQIELRLPSLIGTAHAQSRQTTTREKPSTLDNIIRGFLGSTVAKPKPKDQQRR